MAAEEAWKTRFQELMVEAEGLCYETEEFEDENTARHLSSVS
jgi:hypothetical protein